MLLLVNYTCLLNAANPSPSDALGSKILYYNAPFVYISALVLFVLLIGLKCKNAILASSLASINTVLLDVYLIHEHPLVRSIFISGRFSSFAQHGPIGLAVLTILLVVMIFTTCIALGQLRHCIFKALHVRDLSIQIERLIAQTIDRMYESTAKFIS